MTKKNFQLLAAIRKNGLQSVRKLAEDAGVSTGYISQTLKQFREKQYVDDAGITETGLQALEPYRVENAVIMAAGISSRFLPLSLEKPKGLLKVRNEVLIERQIEQLRAAGIRDIVLVLGYKKEAFFYLEDKYPGIHILINPEYNKKNNVHTLYLARRFLGNSYICSSDDYFEENPFENYVYQSYYAGIPVHQKTQEWYMIPDAKGNIARIEKSGTDGIIMLGHVYWNKEFSTAMTRLLEENRLSGSYDQQLWEEMLMDHLRELPPMEIRVYPEHVIHEFDSLEELQAYDSDYLNDTHSKIMGHIADSLGCAESEIRHFEAIKKGLTNTSFVFEVRGERYVYRHPGEGTEKIICREHEKQALEIARSVGADPSYLTMDGESGWKISRYIDGGREPSYDSPEDSERVIGVMRKLHRENLQVSWSFLPWEEACRIEEILRTEKGGIDDPEFPELRAAVRSCAEACEGDGITPRFCHCDTYAPNWILTDRGETVLIDWEYAGNADPGCDVGGYIMDAGWEIPEGEAFIRRYCGEDCGETERIHYLAYTAIISYYWYVWALYREACGAVMGESLYNWRVMAKRYSEHVRSQLHSRQPTA